PRAPAGVRGERREDETAVLGRLGLRGPAAHRSAPRLARRVPPPRGGRPGRAGRRAGLIRSMAGVTTRPDLCFWGEYARAPSAETGGGASRAPLQSRSPRRFPSPSESRTTFLALPRHGRRVGQTSLDGRDRSGARGKMGRRDDALALLRSPSVRVLHVNNEKTW